MRTAEIIPKEDILKYKLIPVVGGQADELHQKLRNALRLGNEFKSKASIVFQTDEGPKKIETTVWTLTERYLQIKSGVVIPVNTLIDIDY